MATKRKIKKSEIVDITPSNDVLTDIKLHSEPTVYDECEWCFQFDDDEPYVFAAGKSADLTDTPQVRFTLQNNSDAVVEFSFNGKRFKMFAREMTETGRKIIEKKQII